MAVFVDDMHRSPLGRCRGMKMCHMIAENETELHLMADRIGVERRWYHRDHYDLPVAKRVLAVRHGAVQVTMRELAALIFLDRIGQPMGQPATAIERMRAWKRGQLTPGTCTASCISSSGQFNRRVTLGQPCTLTGNTPRVVLRKRFRII